MPMMRGCIPEEETILLGAFQRPCEVQTSLPIRRRASGGPAVRIGPGTAWFQDEFHGVAPDKILNRQVRPVLAWLSQRTRKKVSYFGRDWLAVDGRPVAIIAFAYDGEQDRGVVDTFISARSLITLGDRTSHRGKEPMTLGIDPEQLITVVAKYPTFAAFDDPPWEATAEDAIGLVGAGRDRNGVMRVGGEFMGSSDVDHVAGEHDPALFGARPETLANVIARARGT